MAWSRLQSAENSAAAATTVTATFGANASSGTKIICAIVFSASSISSLTIQDAALNSLTALWTQGSVVISGFCQLDAYAMDTPAGDVGIKRRSRPRGRALPTRRS